MDGLFHIQLLLHSILLGVTAEPPEGHLKLPDAQHIVLPEILERLLTGHPQGGTAHRLAAHPDGVGVGTGVAEGRDAVEMCIRDRLEAADFAREVTMIDYGITKDTGKFVTEISIPVRPKA